jgi:hypothetical protein
MKLMSTYSARRVESLTLTSFLYRVGIDLGMNLPP